MIGGSAWIVILIIVIAIVVFIIIDVLLRRRNAKRSSGVKENLNGKTLIEEQEPVKEDPELSEAKKELYQYLNQTLRKMFQLYRKGQWKRFKHAGVPTQRVQNYYDQIKKSLPAPAGKLLDRYFACIEAEGDEETPAGTVLDSERLRQVFLDMAMPFYPVYYDKLDGIRYTTLLNQTTLNLFHRLTGKKFRMGYKNRYKSGVTAYRWTGDRFEVYTEDGEKLCDAVFKDGKVWEGYAVLPGDKPADRNWDLMQEGEFKEGCFVEGTLHYIYKKPCGEL